MRERLPSRRRSEQVAFECGTPRPRRYLATLGYYRDGRLGEIFIAKDSAIAVSRALQHGDTIEAAGKTFLRDASGSPEGPLGTLFDLLCEGK